jgi:tetratricopeptide (TPR) repeat protein
MPTRKLIAALKKWILLFLMLAPLSYAWGQSKEQLLKSLEKPLPDSSKASNYIDLSSYYMTHDVDSARIMALKGLEIAEKAGYMKGMCLGNLQLGILNQNTGKYKDANGYFFKALKYAEKMGSGRFKVQIFNSIANACSYQKMWDQALVYYTKALAMADSLDMHSKKGLFS